MIILFDSQGKSFSDSASILFAWEMIRRLSGRYFSFLFDKIILFGERLRLIALSASRLVRKGISDRSDVN